MTNIMNPVYHEYPIAEFQGHPLIEALRPLPMDDVEIIKRLSKFPDYDEKELSLPSMFRIVLPQRLSHFLFPMKQHVRIFKNIYGQIFDGYRYRNPMTRDGQELLHEVSNATKCSTLNRTSTISFLTGKSGVGKSTLINAIVDSFGNPVIRHRNYKGVPFTETQITYLKNNAPDQCSPKALCETFGDLTDSLLGTNQSKKIFADKFNRTKYVIGLRKMLECNHVGILIIDAFENISLSRSGGKEELAALIGNMRDGLGVPLLLVGTYKAEEILKRNMSTARRFSEGGYFELENPSSPEEEDWAVFCEIAWRYQWVRKPKPFTDEIRDVLYDLSQGITGIMLTIFIKSQIEAINTGTETVDAKMLRYVYRTQLQPVHDMINALRSKDKKALSRYEDLYRTSATALKSVDSSNRFEELQNQMDRTQGLSKQTDNEIKPKSPKTPRAKKRTIKELQNLVNN